MNSRTKSPTVTPRQGAPSTIRCIKTYVFGFPPFALILVREHPAPSGALRHVERIERQKHHFGQGAPSTIRCIKTRLGSRDRPLRLLGQGAPSTIRCIKTCQEMVTLRPSPRRSQGAPSTIRCIKTYLLYRWPDFSSVVREHPAPSGALRLLKAFRWRS